MVRMVHVNDSLPIGKVRSNWTSWLKARSDGGAGDALDTLDERYER